MESGKSWNLCRNFCTHDPVPDKAEDDEKITGFNFTKGSLYTV